MRMEDSGMRKRECELMKNKATGCRFPCFYLYSGEASHSLPQAAAVNRKRSIPRTKSSS